MLTTIIVTVILGAIIGALARLVLPGKQNISTLVTVILGIVGALDRHLAVDRCLQQGRHLGDRLDRPDHGRHRRRDPHRRLRARRRRSHDHPRLTTYTRSRPLPPSGAGAAAASGSGSAATLESCPEQ